eukprot:TRINITY_DN54863_c0_g1_i1.p1 TRINITY_DN54863_c0_g1~~TRINITY_DN54863_c0_g1_i1.p1  ORF type:complete len:176 (+),score=42.29 TRINITY_DN54863_c0_g1_i1:29-556(+)
MRCLIFAVLVACVICGNMDKYYQRVGKKFLAEKEKEEGVQKLPSGMLIKILKEGKGKKSPKVDDQCDVHYRGTLKDGTEFDSSYKRGEPTQFAPNQVIKGWTEALQLMCEGDKWELYIPQELAYGASGSPPNIPPYTPLIFEIELIKVNAKGKKCQKAKDDLEKKLAEAKASDEM